MLMPDNLYDEEAYRNVTQVPIESTFYAVFLLTGNFIGTFLELYASTHALITSAPRGSGVYSSINTGVLNILSTIVIV